MERFSVSLVFERISHPNRISELKVMVTDAVDESHALGKAMNYFEEEMGDFELKLKAVVNVKRPLEPTKSRQQ